MIKPFLKVDYTKSTLKIWFQSNSWQTPDRLLTELFKSALQIWRAFQISSPNFVFISKNSPHRLLTDSQQTPGLIPDRLTSNPKTVYEIY